MESISPELLTKTYDAIVELHSKVSDRLEVQIEEFRNEIIDFYLKDIQSKRRKTGNIRLDMYYEIMLENHKCIPRVSSHTPADFKKIEKKVIELKQMQLQRVPNPRSYPHPSLWAEYAKAAMYAGNFPLSQELFTQTLQYLEQEEKAAKESNSVYINRIDRIKVGTSIVQLLIAQEKFDEAKDLADDLVLQASEINSIKEKEAVEAKGAIPSDFVSVDSFTNFAYLTALIHHNNWAKDNLIRGCYNKTKAEAKSNQNINAISGWHLMQRLAISTSHDWLLRDPILVKAVFESLHLQMSPNQTDLIWRYAEIYLFRKFKKINSENVQKLTNYSVAASIALLLLLGNPAKSNNVADLQNMPFQQIANFYESKEIKDSSLKAVLGYLKNEIKINEEIAIDFYDTIIKAVEKEEAKLKSWKETDSTPYLAITGSTSNIEDM